MIALFEDGRVIWYNKENTGMKFLQTSLAAMAMAATSMSAEAQDTSTQESDVYLNVGVQSFGAELYNIVGRVGYNFSDNFGVEGEGSFGVIGSSDDFLGETLEVDAEYSFAGYLVGRLPVSKRFDLFARAGYTTVNFEFSIDTQSESLNVDGFVIGGGFQYNFDEQNAVRLGYRYFDTDGIESDGIDLTYVRNF